MTTVIGTASPSARHLATPTPLTGSTLLKTMTTVGSTSKIIHVTSQYFTSLPKTAVSATYNPVQTVTKYATVFATPLQTPQAITIPGTSAIVRSTAIQLTTIASASQQLARTISQQLVTTVQYSKTPMVTVSSLSQTSVVNTVAMMTPLPVSKEIQSYESVAELSVDPVTVANL